ncbi:UvrD-helicase domain-containing protein [Herbivorax sp. ANBcel31]|uniref:UvrD-helicase domain-containing protein n=1 Tax=Herbivorax sp. ANBcel31 TaxID=3069754 RepID=UPI0027AFF739|nr:UvrD-helicase domain-containing protein [Herbivorax sp. ANBcel31]MDQ2087928.1 UvrD-helicase domain-containing protein [Herbivorax sp. ANBcel31]
MNFNKYNKKLKEKNTTDIQNQVILDEVYPNYLKAGAGTGKTEVLVRKIMHIIENVEGVGLDNFAIITFTNKATDEMKERLSERFYYEWLKHKKIAVKTGKIKTEEFMRTQVEITNMLYISTIHGFCEKILRKYGLHIGIPSNFKIASIKKNVNEIINSIVNKHHHEYVLREIPQYKVAKLLSILLEDNCNKGIEFDRESVKEYNFNTENNDYWNDFKRLFMDMYLEISEKIDEFKHSENVLTTDDLIKEAALLMKNKYVLDKASEKYKYILIDEFQDTNKDQFNLVNSLMNNGVNVFLVGDEKQSIYAFRGSDIENSVEMSNIISKIKEKRNENLPKSVMNENFRTDYKLLKKINEIFNHDFSFKGTKIDFQKMRLEKIDELKASDKSEKNPIRISFETDIIDVINHLVENEKIRGKKISYGDIAVFCRSNYDLDVLADRLKGADIPVEVAGGKGFYKSKEVIDTYKLFNSIINTGKEYKTELYFTDYYKAITENEADIDFDNFLNELSTVFREDTVERIIDFIYSETHIEEYYYSKGMYQQIANLQKLKDKARDLMIKEFMQPIQFLEYLNVMIMSNQEEDDADIAEVEKNSGVVSLYSIHKAKGLAFKVVIVPYFDKKINRPTVYPKIILKNKSGEKRLAIGSDYFNDEVKIEDKDYTELLENKIIEFLEEELRILYVALTRPKNMLILLCDNSKQYLNKCMKQIQFVSWAKWISEIDNGHFLNDHIWQIEF